MAFNPQKPLKVITALIILIALQGCNGSPSSGGQEGVDSSDLDEPPPTATPTDVPPTQAPREWGDSVTWLATDSLADTGLQLGAKGDWDTEAVIVGSPAEHAHRTGNGEALPSDDGNSMPDFYMQFYVNDSFLFRGSPTPRLQIEIEYLDEGTDYFEVEYDGLGDGGPFGDGRFSPVGYMHKTDSGEFRVVVLDVGDAFFSNRDNGGDFRISDVGDGAETIRRVTVKRILPPTGDDSALYMDFFDDGDYLILGQCTTLHWTVWNATEVTLNGEPVDMEGFDYECPDTSTTYSLNAQNDTEQMEEEITIVVSQPDHASAPGEFDYSAFCRPRGDNTGFIFYIYYTSMTGHSSEPTAFEARTGGSYGTGIGVYSLIATVPVPSIAHDTTFSWDTDSLEPCCSISPIGGLWFNDSVPANDRTQWCHASPP